MNVGDVVIVDFGVPVGSEAGFRRPGIVLVDNAFLRYRPSTIFVVPLTTTPRRFPSHVEVAPDDDNGLDGPSWALVEQMRAVAVERCERTGGDVGPVVVSQVLDVLAMITGMP